MDLFLIYLLLINALGFLLMLTDKRRAKKNLWRISEVTFLGIAVIGGSLGILLGMYFARHKTRHLKFAIGVPTIFAAQVVLAVILYCK